MGSVYSAGPMVLIDDTRLLANKNAIVNDYPQTNPAGRELGQLAVQALLLAIHEDLGNISGGGGSAGNGAIEWFEGTGSSPSFPDNALFIRIEDLDAGTTTWKDFQGNIVTAPTENEVREITRSIDIILNALRTDTQLIGSNIGDETLAGSPIPADLQVDDANLNSLVRVGAIEAQQIRTFAERENGSDTSKITLADLSTVASVQFPIQAGYNFALIQLAGAPNNVSFQQSTITGGTAKTISVLNVRTREWTTAISDDDYYILPLLGEDAATNISIIYTQGNQGAGTVPRVLFSSSDALQGLLGVADTTVLAGILNNLLFEITELRARAREFLFHYVYDPTNDRYLQARATYGENTGTLIWTFHPIGTNVSAGLSSGEVDLLVPAESRNVNDFTVSSNATLTALGPGPVIDLTAYTVPTLGNWLYVVTGTGGGDQIEVQFEASDDNVTWVPIDTSINFTADTSGVVDYPPSNFNYLRANVISITGTPSFAYRVKIGRGV